MGTSSETVETENSNTGPSITSPAEETPVDNSSSTPVEQPVSSPADDNTALQNQLEGRKEESQEANNKSEESEASRDEPSPLSCPVKRGSNSSSSSGDGTKSNVSAMSLAARFEQKAAESAAETKRIVGKRNFSVPKTSKCAVCTRSVYAMEKLEVEGVSFHKTCFKCETCKRALSAGNYASLQGKYYCKPHLKQLFQLKGNYDEGFGREQRKSDWERKGDASPSSPVKPTLPVNETPEEKDNEE